MPAVITATAQRRLAAVRTAMAGEATGTPNAEDVEGGPPRGHGRGGPHISAGRVNRCHTLRWSARGDSLEGWSRSHHIVALGCWGELNSGIALVTLGVLSSFHQGRKNYSSARLRKGKIY